MVPRWHARRLTAIGWDPGLGIKLVWVWYSPIGGRPDSEGEALQRSRGGSSWQIRQLPTTGDPTEPIWQGGSLHRKKKKKKGEAERNGSGVRQLGSILVLILLSSVNLGKLNSLCLSFLIEIIIVSHRGVAWWPELTTNEGLEQCLAHS